MEEGAGLRSRLRKALANTTTTTSTQRIAWSDGACENPGKAPTPMIREEKLKQRGGGDDGERCSLPRHRRCESRTGVIILPKAPAGLDEFVRPLEMRGIHGHDGICGQNRRSRRLIRWLAQLTSGNQVQLW